MQHVGEGDTYQENGLLKIQGYVGRVSPWFPSGFWPANAFVKKFFATPKHFGWVCLYCASKVKNGLDCFISAVIDFSKL